MVTGGVVAAGVAKAASAWVGGLLTEWLRSRKSNAAEAKLWTEISTKILKQTKVTADRYSKIVTVAFPRDPVAVDEIYVPLTIEHSSSGLSAIVDAFPLEFIENNPRMLIVDAAGMGKSTLSKILFRRSLNEKCYLPILVDLRRLDGTEELEQVLAKQFGLKQKHLDLLSDFLATQPILYLLDGFDEVIEGKKIDVARTLRHFIDRADKARFVITSRPDIPFSEYTDFGSFHIKELTRDQSHSLIKKYGNAYDIDNRARALLEELKARHGGPVESFLKNPLLTSLLFRAFEFKSVIPVKRGVFYRQVFDALYESHDLSKETGYVREKKTGLHHDDFHRALRALAKLFRQARAVEVEIDKFIEMARSVSKSLCPDLSFTPEAMLNDVVHAVPLFIKDGNLIRWAHKSLLDYFLCEFLLRDYAESKAEALGRAASGVNSRTNENFLILVQEADPILYANAITIPSIDKLLARYAEIFAKIPKDVSPDVAADISEFFMNHEVLIARDTQEVVTAWVEKSGPQNVPWGELVPVMIYQYSAKHGVSVFAHEAASALSAAFDLGVIPASTVHVIARKYPEQDSPSLGATSTIRGFISSRKTKADWENVEEEFAVVMGLLRSADIRMATFAALKKAKQDLEKLVVASLESRSNHIF